MKNPNAIVSRTIRFEPPIDRAPQEILRSEQGVTLVLDQERRVRLDSEDPKSPGFINILEGLRKQEMPVYLELSPGDSGITRLLIPFVTYVSNISKEEGGVAAVEIEYSHGIHFLKKDETGDFDELRRKIEEALKGNRAVILTEDDAHNIIDITFFEPKPNEPQIPHFRGPKFPTAFWWLFIHWIWRWHIWPWWWFRCISFSKAQQVFDAMKATTCDPLTVPVPCIPFLYPDDGCWGRAHEMCRLMINMGRKPRKVWIQGSLHVNTKNNPNCAVYWGWHVAPTLCVRRRWFHASEMVIDPSLFNSPVTKANWKGVQGDTSATLTDSAASQFMLGGATDPTYSQTNTVLATYRLKLQTRALQFGAPPYANCP